VVTVVHKVECVLCGVLCLHQSFEGQMRGVDSGSGWWGLPVMLMATDFLLLSTVVLDH